MDIDEQKMHTYRVWFRDGTYTEHNGYSKTDVKRWFTNEVLGERVIDYIEQIDRS